jgi:hypothetical protein
MASEKRENIGAQWNAQEANKLNNMLMWIWKKIHGDINFVDVNPNVKAQMFTNWLQPQGEGNLDSTHPIYFRFYVPADVKKIKSASLNAIVSRYRMDSAVTASSGQITTAAIVTSGSSNVETAPVDKWGPYDSIGTPQQPSTGAENIVSMDPVSDGYIADGYYKEVGSGGGLMMAVAKAVIQGTQELYAWVDLYRMQHRHNIQHSHSGSANITIEGHSHGLNEGIIESSVQPQLVNIYLNDNVIVTAMSEVDSVKNNLDILPYVVPGQWNIIKITCDNLARITVYGIIELVQMYSNNL